ncbi:multidrug effflux MFS transporter [Rhodobacter capsulatus]|uniref:Bcr/CflA family efflux transporter n=1 Tax=Rhodobacter capsulatus TaxID=1061 RepID=A0A4U1JQX0_RHOCA|nr:multidrug effflux MFS transporter [Rhodobacter capsulatus]TKD21408.1 multidrug effflux MFS transporter [Rhodobacter capsulatus]
MTVEKPSPTIALVLGGLSALGPLAIDMYLPGLPTMVTDLGTNEGTIQYSLMVFFAGLTLGQLFYGPLSDRYGRKPLAYFGLALFVLGSLGSAFAGSVESLILFRAIEGLGGSIGMVIAMAVIRDLYTGHAAGRMMALVLMVLGVSPVLAPLAGSAMLAIADWKAIFLVLALVGLALIVCVAVALPETRAPEIRRASHPGRAFRHYLSLLGSRQFLPFVLVSAVAQAGFFAYISGSAFVFISVHGLSPTEYSVLFALNAVGLVIANQLSAPATRRFGSYAVARAATLVLMVSGLALVGMELAGLASVWSHSLLLFFVVAQAGMVMPVLSVRAMASFGSIAGTAAAMLGAIQFVGAAAASGAVGALADGTALPLVCVIAGCGIGAAAIAFAAFPSDTLSR